MSAQRRAGNRSVESGVPAGEGAGLGGVRCTWRSWSGVQAEPGRTGPLEVEVVQARDTAHVAEILTEAARRGRRVRPLGSGHSFSDIGRPVDVAIDLAALTGITRIDADPADSADSANPAGSAGGARVRVGGGIVLRALNAALEVIGSALPNLGAIDAQTIAGALATGTGTHGTGGRLQGIASAVCALTLVTVDGTIHELRRGDELFEAARINLGALGVVTEVELECVPAFRLQAMEGPMPLAGILDDLDGFVNSADHAEFFWFPHTSRASARRNVRVEAQVGRPLPRWRGLVEDRLLSNGVYELVNRAGSARPQWVPRLNRICASMMGERTYADASHRVFCSVRSVRFVETEYAVPREATHEVLREMKAWFDSTRAPVSFPLEVRFLSADDVWLSGAYGRDTAYIAVHQYWRAPYEELFARFEQVVAAHGGRPHWGKMHGLDAQRLEEVHPRLAEFKRVRDRLDPGRVLSSPHLERILGP